MKITNVNLKTALLPICFLWLVLANAQNKNDNNKIMDIKELQNAFAKDESSALKLYGEKMVEIRGYVTYVGPNMYALPSIELSDQKAGTSLALCVLPTRDYLKLRKYSKGELLTIVGKVRGFYVEGKQVVLKESKVQEKK